MASNQSGEGEIRKKLVEEDIIDCMVALPGQLFYSTQIPTCLWFLARDRKNHKFRDRRGEVLFIDARKMGRMADRTHRDLTDEDVTRIPGTYHLWRGETDVPSEAVEGRTAYEDIPGFCKAATLEEIRTPLSAALRTRSASNGRLEPEERRQSSSRNSVVAISSFQSRIEVGKNGST